MDVNPAYGDFASNSVKTDEDTGLDKLWILMINPGKQKQMILK